LITDQLKNYNEISGEWNLTVRDNLNAVLLTLKQLEAFEMIINDDDAWEFLLNAFNNGRDTDAWLASDWPDGFDELVLCIPLCKLVSFECDKCFVGMRQENNSCAHDDSLFGYIAELLNRKDRAGLKLHISDIKKMFSSVNYRWNIGLHKLETV